MKISLKQSLWENDRHVVLDLPEAWRVEVLRMAGDSGKVLGAGAQ
jgi:hypothetical protein